MRALRVDTKQNKEARHVLPVNQENIKHKNNKQNASTAMQENKLPMMPATLPVTSALKGGTKQNQAALLVWRVYVENNKQNASTAMQENKLPMMPVLLLVTSALKGAIRQTKARLLVWGVYLENIKMKLKNKNVKIAKLVEHLQA